MRKYLRAILREAVVIVLASIMGLVIGLAAARVSLPRSPCAVGEEAIAALEVEKMKEAEVVARLGCDGDHVVQHASEQLRIETILWRGDAWPYARFEALLINGVLHGTKKIWLDLTILLPPKLADQD